MDDVYGVDHVNMRAKMYAGLACSRSICMRLGRIATSTKQDASLTAEVMSVVKLGMELCRYILHVLLLGMSLRAWPIVCLIHFVADKTTSLFECLPSMGWTAGA